MTEIGSMFVFKHARHDRGTGGHTDSRGVVMSVEDHAVIGQAVKFRALYIFVPVAAERVCTLVIGKQKYDIWFSFAFRTKEHERE